MTSSTCSPSLLRILLSRAYAHHDLWREVASRREEEKRQNANARRARYAGVRCRVLGTFYVNNFGSDGKPDYRLTFGSDLSNYYPNRGLKVFKPRSDILAKIINYRDPLSIPSNRVSELPGLKTPGDVRRFAKSIGVAPGIVVGRLQHDKLITYSYMNDLKQRFKWAEG